MISAAPRSYTVLTLGCKLNQFDSATIEGLLRARGFERAPSLEQSAVVVINTCTVTDHADREARRLARHARRKSPRCRLLVTGCYAELDRTRLLAMAEIDAVIGHSDRARIPALLDAFASEAGREAPRALPCGPPCGDGEGRSASAATEDLEARSANADAAAQEQPAAPADMRRNLLEPEPTGEIACLEAAFDRPTLYFGDRNRAFLKIQEGCALGCSYCIIPRVRGESRSVEPAAVEAALAQLVDRGYREIVLTGVNTGDYGKDLTPRTSLAELLRELVRTPGLGRIRLNSLEPRTVTPEVVHLLRNDARVARHLQIPLQSGSDRILRRMRRNYTTSDYLRILERLRSEIPDIALGADVIVGFPGETDEEFDRTCRFIERAALAYLHVFSYSDRPGTPASMLDGHVRPERIRDRSARLRALGEARSRAFRRSFLGRTLPVLVYDKRRPDGRFRGLSDNFIDVSVEVDPSRVRTIVHATISRADADETIAVAANNS